MKLSTHSFAFFTHHGKFKLRYLISSLVLILAKFLTAYFYFVLCSYEKEEMKKYVLHLLVLSHSYSVPSLKRVCIYFLEQGWLTKENVVDVLQLARNCDAPRLSLICVRMIVKDFKAISSTEGWKVMKKVNPALEQELLEFLVEADSVSWFLLSFSNIVFYNCECLHQVSVESFYIIVSTLFRFLLHYEHGRSYVIQLSAKCKSNSPIL